MILEQNNLALEFELKQVSFSELKTLREACRDYAKKGSAQAEKIYQSIERFMNEKTI